MRDLYGSLPVIAQNLACTWAGFTRARSRYNTQYKVALESLIESAQSTEEQFHALQWKRLLILVDRARNYVPFYSDLPPASDASDPKRAIDETLARIQPLEKATYRERCDEFLASDINPNSIQKGKTSGTTGTALPLYYTLNTLAEEYATVWRQRSFQGVRQIDRHATFGGQIIVPFKHTSPPYWRTNLYGRQKLFSVYHMTPENLELYIDEIHRRRLRYINGYPSALYLVARAMLKSGRKLQPGHVSVIFTSSESLLAYQKQVIEEAFGAKVWDRYGTSEFAVSMTACELGHLHVDMEFCIVEVEIEEETEEYVRGPLCVTGLATEATPFIRYQIGDTGTRLKAPCPCGRRGDVFLDIDGRSEDYVMTPDGRLLGRLDHIFKDQPDIVEAQIHQDSKEAIEVLFVPGENYNLESEARLLREVRARLGDEIHVDLKSIPSIPRERNGKFRAVKSTLEGILND